MLSVSDGGKLNRLQEDWLMPLKSYNLKVWLGSIVDKNQKDIALVFFRHLFVVKNNLYFVVLI